MEIIEDSSAGSMWVSKSASDSSALAPLLNKLESWFSFDTQLTYSLQECLKERKILSIILADFWMQMLLLSACGD